ncbi:MAG TPA: FAD-binding oxidoreductase [Edaphobacter sp.]|nr:FAD-binding oxidoreductase [Edaphobacter sp.]
MPHSTNLQTFADDLAAIIGPEHLRVEGGIFLVAPANNEEIAAILRYANENSISITPCGGGTKQRWGNPIQTSLMLHMHRLNSVREHTWQDMTCTVEAGCTWSSMQFVLAEHAQFVALDPVWPDRATIGGIAATNDSGSLRLRYGSLRDLIIGMTVVLADGTIARSGGKVVKNVAGYDLHKLMTGAFGTLGIITEITFRLHAIPKHAQTFTISSAAPEPLGQLLLKILDSHLSTQSLQLRSTTNGFNLDVRLATLPEVIHTQASSLTALAQGLHLSVADQDPNVWTARQQLFDQPASFLIKATMLPSDIPRIAATIQNLGGTSITQATGIMTASIPVSASSRLASLRQHLEALHGCLIILHSPADTTPITSSSPTDTLPLMREIKHRFDPNHILNPGRFLGGI